jgi:hypothetical protein
MAFCAIRISREDTIQPYQENKAHTDGWSINFDEWIPVYSPRIMPKSTRVGIDAAFELDDDFDETIELLNEFKGFFAVPRLQNCSSLYLRCINQFGIEGGFDIIMDLLTRFD